MAGYIDREEVINLLWLFADESCCSIVSDIENLPAADVAPVKHGKWLLNGSCSECLANPLTTHRNYCPHCGAKMDGGGDNAAD